MSKDQRGLGKGLGAILGEVSTIEPARKPVGYLNKEVLGPRTKPAGTDIVRIPVDMIEPNPYQPRMSFDQESLDELTASIRTLGLIQPITVRRLFDDKYQIISGERRYKACRQAGMTMIPAFVRDATDQGMHEMALVENVQRQDLDPIELALSYQRLIDECSLTQDEMADRIGKSRSTVANTIRLLKLPAKVQHDIKVGILSQGHAKAIISVDDPELQMQLCDIVVRDGLNVRQLEALVRKIKLGGKVPAKRPVVDIPLPDEYNQVLSHMGRFFSKDISVKRSASGKGTMTIHFDSDDEVLNFLQALDEIRN